MMTFEIWAADYTVLEVQAVAALLSQVKIVRLSYSLYEFANCLFFLLSTQWDIPFTTDKT